MADVQTTDINTKPTVTAIDSNDQIYISYGGTALKKISYTNLAKAIIEQYNASQLAGATKTIQAAFNELNSNLPYVSTGTIASAIASKVTAGVNHGFFLAKNDLADIPSGAYYKIEYIRVAGTNNVYVKAYANHATDNTYEALFDYTNVTSLSGLWTKFPTRAEVDALNSKTSAFQNIPPLSSVNVGGNKKLVLTMNAGSANYRGFLVLFVQGNTAAGNPQICMFSWGNGGTAVTVSHVLGANTVYDGATIDGSNTAAVKVSIPMVSYETISAFASANVVSGVLTIENA